MLNIIWIAFFCFRFSDGFVSGADFRRRRRLDRVGKFGFRFFQSRFFNCAEPDRHFVFFGSDCSKLPKPPA